MNDENIRFAGHTPEDNVTPERYAVALEQLQEFVQVSSSEVLTLADLSKKTMSVRSALRDVVVSHGVQGRYQLPDVAARDIDGNPITVVMPRSYELERDKGEMTIHIGLEQYGDDERLILIKLLKSNVNLRVDTEEKQRILHIVSGYLPKLKDAIGDALRGCGLGDGLETIVRSAVGSAMKKTVNPNYNEDEQAYLITNKVITALIEDIEQGHGPFREMDVHVPVYKSFQECKPVEVGAFDCLESLKLVNPILYPDDEIEQQNFLRAFQSIVSDVLPLLPPPTL